MTSPSSQTFPFGIASDPKERLIVALDVASAKEARTLMEKLGSTVLFYKVGLQLFTTAGPDFVCELCKSGKKVFLDLKFHDIPNTVSGAVTSSAALGVHMLTVHAGGGSKMLSVAAEAAASSGRKDLTILAVTVLTSTSDRDLAELGIANADSEQQVLRLARLAKEAGCNGLVLSPQEIMATRKAVGKEMAIVTPGIRATESQKDDQARVATASEAIRNGASHLVIGRPITAAPDPLAAAQAFLQEIAMSGQ